MPLQQGLIGNDPTTNSDNLGFRNHSVLIKLDNGTILIPFMDNEMNDGGAIGVLNNGDLSTLYSK